MRKLTLAVAATAVAGLMALASPALAQTTVTTFAPETNETPGVWYKVDQRGGGTSSITDLTGAGGTLDSGQPLPKGAALLTTDDFNTSAAGVGVLDDFGTPAGIFPTFSFDYSYYKDATGNTADPSSPNQSAAPSLKLVFENPVCLDPASGGDCKVVLIYEPYWNSPLGPGLAGAPVNDAWTTVSIDQNTGVFWSTGGFGSANGAGGPPFNTLAGWLATLSSDFGDSDLTIFYIGVGSYNKGQIGYIDDVEIAGTNANGWYDFEAAPEFETLGECISTWIGDECSGLTGKERATCNYEIQMSCFQLFGIQ